MREKDIESRGDRQTNCLTVVCLYFSLPTIFEFYKFHQTLDNDLSLAKNDTFCPLCTLEELIREPPVAEAVGPLGYSPRFIILASSPACSA